MRVIGGTARGRTLEAPRGMQVRPTLDRVRESLFNILAPSLPNARFLDLFAGSGANGIEALSRGAIHATFVDNDARSLAVIRKNLDTLDFKKDVRVLKYSLPAGLERLDGEEPFHIIYADPPYVFARHERLLELIRTHHLLAQGGLIVVEHGARMVLPDDVACYACDRRNRYGEAALSFFVDK